MSPLMESRFLPPQLLIRLEGMSTHQIAVGHSIRIFNVTRVPVEWFHGVRFHRMLPVFTKISLYGWWSDVSQHVASHLSFQTNALKTPLVLILLPSLFNLSCFGPKSGACLFFWALLFFVNVFYICPSHKKVLGMKRNCP